MLQQLLGGVRCPSSTIGCWAASLLQLLGPGRYRAGGWAFSGAVYSPSAATGFARVRVARAGASRQGRPGPWRTHRAQRTIPRRRRAARRRPGSPRGRGGPAGTACRRAPAGEGCYFGRLYSKGPRIVFDFAHRKPDLLWTSLVWRFYRFIPSL